MKLKTVNAAMKKVGTINFDGYRNYRVRVGKKVASWYDNGGYGEVCYITVSHDDRPDRPEYDDRNSETHHTIKAAVANLICRQRTLTLEDGRRLWINATPTEIKVDVWSRSAVLSNGARGWQNGTFRSAVPLLIATAQAVCDEDAPAEALLDLMADAV